MAVKARVVIEVIREFVVIGLCDSQWELQPFSATVWTWDSGTGVGKAKAIKVNVPDGYLPGLLTARINGHKVAAHVLDEYLKDTNTGLTRKEIESAIRLAQ